MSAMPLPATTRSERQWAMGVHVGVLIMAVLTSWAAGLAGAITAGVILAIKPLGSAFVAEHARQALNFNLSMFLYSIIAVAVAFLTLGLALIVIAPVALLIFAAWVVCSIMAAGAALEGRMYRYPFTLQLF